MSDILYRKELLRLAADAHGAGRLAEPKLTGEARNPVCGDQVKIDLRLENGRIADIALETKACVLTQASASILGKHAKGQSRKDIEELKRGVTAMLEKPGTVPASPFAEFGAFEGAVAYPGRHQCVLLPLDALLAAFHASNAR